MHKKTILLLLFGIFQCTLHASLSKAGAEKTKAATLTIATSAATATAAAESVGSAAAKKSCNQDIVNARLVEYVKRGDVLGVNQQLAKCAHVDARNEDYEPVLHTAIDRWLNDRKGKDRIYQAITIALLKAGARLQSYGCVHDVLECIPHLVDRIPVVYKQEMYDAQGKPSWLHTFFANLMHDMIYITAKDNEENIDAQEKIEHCVSAILNAGFDIIVESGPCRTNRKGRLKNIYALMKDPSLRGSFMTGNRTRVRKSVVRSIEYAHEFNFQRPHKENIQESLNHVLPATLLDLVYECLYVRPYESISDRVPRYIRDLLTIELPGNENRGSVEEDIAQRIARYGQLGGYIPVTKELSDLVAKQASECVQEALDRDNDNEQRYNAIFCEDGETEDEDRKFDKPFVDTWDECTGYIRRFGR